MIRRGFWLVLGAAGGIMGYRRASALGRQVSQTLGSRPAAARGVATVARRRRHWARATFRFTRDVREGMDLYIDRQRARSAPTLGSGAAALDHPDPGMHDQRGAHDKHGTHDKREDH